MKIIHGNGGDLPDDQLQRELQRVYGAPRDESFWTSLEHRIMSSVRAELPAKWWSHFPGWVRYGLAAAAAATVAISVANWQLRAVESRIAYEELAGDPTGVPLLTEVFDERTEAQRENTLRYLISR